MSRLGLIFRWIAALLIAVIANIAALGLVAVLCQRFGADPVAAVNGMAGAGTFAAILAGTFVLPRERWRTGALAIWVLTVIPYLLFSIYHFSALNLEAFGAALTAGMIVYLSIFNSTRAVAQHSHYENETVIGPLPRPLRKWGPAFSILFAGGMAFVAVENLYSAIRYHSVMGWHTGWISYGEHPIEFWLLLLLTFVVLLVMPLLTFLKLREGRRLREREARPPLENIIRQSVYER